MRLQHASLEAQQATAQGKAMVTYVAHPPYIMYMSVLIKLQDSNIQVQGFTTPEFERASAYGFGVPPSNSNVPPSKFEYRSEAELLPAPAQAVDMATSGETVDGSRVLVLSGGSAQDTRRSSLLSLDS